MDRLLLFAAALGMVAGGAPAGPVRDPALSTALKRYPKARLATPADLAPRAADQARLDQASATVRAEGDLDGDNLADHAILLREAADTILVVVSGKGAILFAKRYGADPPRGVRYEAAIGETTVVFDAGDPDHKARRLVWNRQRKRIDLAERDGNEDAD